MKGNSLINEWKEKANLIIGMWHNEKEDLKFIFSLSEGLLGRATLIIIRNGKKPEKTFYTLAVQPRKELTDETYFYFDISFMGKPKYAIKEISPFKMVLRLMDYTTYEEIGEKMEFRRLADLGYAEDILKGLD